MYIATCQTKAEALTLVTRLLQEGISQFIVILGPNGVVFYEYYI